MNKRQKLLEWIAKCDGGLLEIQITSSGMSKVLDELILEGLVTIIPHATVKEGKAPAAAVVLREKRKENPTKD